MRYQSVFTWSASERKIRLFRIIWEHRGSQIGLDPMAYSAMVSFSLVPRIYRNEPVLFGFDVSVLGLRIHYQRNYGGRFP